MTNATETFRLKTASPAAWYLWALDQFNLFNGAPRPVNSTGSNDDVVRWLPLFKRWLASGAGDTRKRTVAQCLVRCFNNTTKIRGAGDLWLEYGGMDETNRRGVRTVLEHVRYF